MAAASSSTGPNSLSIASENQHAETAKLLLYKAAAMVDQGLPIIKESCMAKIVANEMSQKVSNMAMQLLGGYGYMKEFPVERNFRDCRGFAFGGGTPQVLRTVLAGQLVK